MPKDAARVRKMIRKLASEVIDYKDGGKRREVTRLEKLVLGMLGSDSPVDRVNILKALYPELFETNLNVKSNAPMKLNVIYVDNRKQETAQGDVVEGEVKE